MKPDFLATPANKHALGAVRGGLFPHMGPQDSAVWKALLSLNLVEFERYEYDVRLGGKAAHSVPKEHELSRMWLELMKKRVDVIGWTGKQATLIEVKPVGSMAALGQVLAYGYLWKQKHSAELAPRLCVACAVVDPDIEAIFGAYGIRVVALPESLAEAILRPRLRTARD